MKTLKSLVLVSVVGLAACSNSRQSAFGSHLAASSGLASDQFEFVVLASDGTYSAQRFHGTAATGTWQNPDAKHVTLTDDSTAVAETREISKPVDLSLFYGVLCTTSWQPRGDDGMITYRSLTIIDATTYSGTFAEGSTQDSGTYKLGFQASSRRVTGADGAVTFVPQLTNAIQLLPAGSSDTWTQGIDRKGRQGFTIEEDVTDGNDGRYPLYKAAN